MAKSDVTNREIARILQEIGIFLEMQEVDFKPRAYRKAAEAIEAMDEEVQGLYRTKGLKGIEDIPGVGASIARKIEELLKTGRLKYHEDLKNKAPVDLQELSKIEGLGPKSMKRLYDELGVKTMADLERMAQAGKIAALPGFGKKSEENILKGIGFVKRSRGRFLLGAVMPEIRMLEARLKSLEHVEEIVVAGSVRRRRETIGDVDILAISENPKPIMDFFVSMPEVGHVYAHGDTKSAVKLKSGLDADLRVVPRAAYGAALNYFTGSKDHNVALRELATKRGCKLNEYGLFKGRGQVAGKTEEDLYKALGLEYIEPEMRENAGEIELAQKRELPKLIGYDDLRGDLQVQSNWTDGAASIEEMARAAHEAGLKYIVITDHTKLLAMTHGLDEKRIVKQWIEIDRVNRKMKDKITVLKGSECDILKDGSLDLPDDVLAKLDLVGASVHSHFKLSREDQTERIRRAMSSPHVDILFHPTGRLIQKREPYDLDIDAIIETAKKTGTVLEIDALPERLDLKDDHIRKAVEAHVKLAIDSDAHAPQHFAILEYGIAQARRGWAERKDIINAWPLDKMLSLLKK